MSEANEHMRQTLDEALEQNRRLGLALQEIASWEDEAPPRGERTFAQIVLKDLDPAGSEGDE